MLKNRRVCGLRLPDFAPLFPNLPYPFDDTRPGMARLPFYRGTYARGNPVTTLLSYRNPTNQQNPVYPGGRQSPYYANPNPGNILGPERNLKLKGSVDMPVLSNAAVYQGVQQSNNANAPQISGLPFYGTAPSTLSSAGFYGGTNSLPGYTSNYPTSGSDNVPGQSFGAVSYSSNKPSFWQGNPWDIAGQGNEQNVAQNPGHYPTPKGNRR